MRQDIHTARPTQTPMPSFADDCANDIAIPRSVFPDDPPPQDFSEPVDGKALFVDAWAEEDGEGSFERPFRDIQRAVDSLKPGGTLYFRGGIYETNRPVLIYGKQNVTIASYGREQATVDGSGYDGDAPDFDTENGVFTVDHCDGLVLKNMHVQSSHCKGISVFNSNNIEISHCRVENTFACGIAVWDRSPLAEKTNAWHGFRIVCNDIRKANTWDMIPKGRPREGEPPHEAISIAGATDFEVAYNHVHDCDKEGIDVKENSRSGVVHHNYVHHCDRQGLYADAWFGKLDSVTFRHNVVAHNRGAGLALSVEGAGSSLTRVCFEHNIVYGNWGSGLFISRWGHDLMREYVTVRANTFVRNGHGGSYGSHRLFWLTGGIYFYSGNIRHMIVENNILSDDDTFEIGFADIYGHDIPSIRQALSDRDIVIAHNRIDYRDNTRFPVTVGWPDNYAAVLQYAGDDAVFEPPAFHDVEKQDSGI